MVTTKGGESMVTEVLLKDTSAITRLNNVACEEGMDITVSKGSIIVDARSILALFALMGSKVTLTAPDNANPADFMRAVKRMNL